MSTSDPTSTRQMLTELAAVDGLRDRCEAFNALSAMPSGSRAEADAALSRLLGAEPVRAAMVQAANSLDHLMTWRHVLSTGLQPAVAHMSLLRASMEASVVARWLVDVDAPPTERLARAASWLREDYRQRGRIEAITKAKATPPAKSAAERTIELDAEIAALGLRAPTAVNLTDLFRGYCHRRGDEGEAIYSTVSAFAHGRPWAALLLSASPVGTGVAPGGKVLRTSANERIALAFTVHALRTAALAVEEVERHLRP